MRRLGPGEVTPQLGPEEIDTVKRRPAAAPAAADHRPARDRQVHAGLRDLPGTGPRPGPEWNIVSRSTLRDGLYVHDAMGRAQAIAAWQAGLRGAAPGGTDGSGPAAADPAGASVEEGASAGPDGVDPAVVPSDRQLPPVLGDFITLGPLGTALLPYDPRVLLVDELDKSDIDLPNDLLHVLENGSYEVPELVRDAAATARVHTSDPAGQALVRDGRVECREFPVVVITSNGEREFPAAFRRRCLPLELRTPDREQLLALVEGHLGMRPEGTEALVDEFVGRIRSGGTHSLDQLLNAVQMTTGVVSRRPVPGVSSWKCCSATSRRAAE